MKWGAQISTDLQFYSIIYLEKYYIVNFSRLLFWFYFKISQTLAIFSFFLSLFSNLMSSQV